MPLPHRNTPAIRPALALSAVATYGDSHATAVALHDAVDALVADPSEASSCARPASDLGRWLYTTENDIDRGRGVVVVRDAAAGASR